MLADPVLRIYDAARRPLAENDNWQTGSQLVEDSDTNLQPYNPHEAAYYFEALPPGNHTAILSGAGNSTGVGLDEVYELK